MIFSYDGPKVISRQQTTQHNNISKITKIKLAKNHDILEMSNTKVISRNPNEMIKMKIKMKQ